MLFDRGLTLVILKGLLGLFFGQGWNGLGWCFGFVFVFGLDLECNNNNEGSVWFLVVKSTRTNFVIVVFLGTKIATFPKLSQG